MNNLLSTKQKLIYYCNKTDSRFKLKTMKCSVLNTDVWQKIQTKTINFSCASKYHFLNFFLCFLGVIPSSLIYSGYSFSLFLKTCKFGSLCQIYILNRIPSGYLNFTIVPLATGRIAKLYPFVENSLWKFVTVFLLNLILLLFCSSPLHKSFSFFCFYVIDVLTFSYLVFRLQISFFNRCISADLIGSSPPPIHLILLFETFSICPTPSRTLIMS